MNTEKKKWGRPKRNWFPVSRKTTSELQYTNPSILKLYIVLCNLSNMPKIGGKHNGIFWRTDAMLMKATTLSQPTIIKARKWLIANGYLECVKGKSHRATQYKILR